MPKREKEILKVEKLNVTFEKKRIIENLSFKLNKGEVLVVLGPNGAGKTTLLRALLNLVPYQGSIQWNSKKISYLPPQELIERNYLPPLTIKDFFKLKKVSDYKIKKIFREIGLPQEILERQFGELSTGQFQRMMLAWALVNDPEVLLFDEVMYGIDAGGKETIYSLLHKFWKKNNLTILMVTHDLSIVWEHANKVLCLNKKKLCYGEPKKILTTENLRKTYKEEIKFYKHHHG